MVAEAVALSVADKRAAANGEAVGAAKAALVLAASGELEADALCRVHDAGTQGAAEVAEALVSLVRRSLVGPSALDALASALGAHALVPVVRQALADSPAVPVVAERPRIDYLELVRAWKSRPKVVSTVQ